MTGIVGFLGEGHVLYQCQNICRYFGIDTIHFDNSDDILNEYCDVLFVFRYKKILPDSILKTPPEGCIMTHYSKLPKYRGFHPINHAIRYGETEIGITMFYGDAGTDTGDILLQRTIPIDINETVEEIYERCDVVAIKMFRDIIIHVMKGTASRTKQKTNKIFGIPFRKDELNNDIDENEFDNLLDLHNLIRSHTGKDQERMYVEDGEYRLYFDKTTLVKK